jgi:formylglycine-generating enzyme required for sulfatase activity
MSTEATKQIYKDFVIKLGRDGDSLYRAEVQGPTGEAKTDWALPFDEEKLETFLREHAGPYHTSRQGQVLRPVQPTIDFGGQLYDAVISGAVRDAFVGARQVAEREGYDLRLKLRLSDVPELADVPWEFLYDGRGFLSLSTATPLVRYLDLPHRPRPLKAELPLRILVTVSSPQGLPSLDVAEERENVRQALSALLADKSVDVEFMTNFTLRDLQRELLRAKSRGHPYHVWHYIGHGAFDPQAESSMLMFCDDNDLPMPVGGFQLGTLFSSYPATRLILLNACEGARPDRHDPFGGVAAALVECGVPAVLGMQFAITNKVAITFGEGFYTALVNGLPVDAATTEARRSVFFMPNWVEWATPVLYMRSPDGELFHIWGHRTNRSQKVYPPRQPFESQMIRIPAGRFLMGSDPSTDRPTSDNEQPKHPCHLPAFYIARTPVTNDQYAAFVRATDHEAPSHWQGGSPPRGKRDHPVVNVSWRATVDYCRWLAGVTGRPYRLPSEAEWEKAARGPRGDIYPWGNEWDASRCNSKEAGIVDTTPVEQYPQGASSYEALDMAGNVWEWTQSAWGRDWRESQFKYPYDPGDGRENLDAASGMRRVVRGGSFIEASDNTRAACRYGYDPNFCGPNVGFRVATTHI